MYIYNITFHIIIKTINLSNNSVIRLTLYFTVANSISWCK